MTLNKQVLTDRLSANTKMSKEEIYIFLGFLLEEIKEALLRGETVTLATFGTFRVKKRKNLKRGFMATYNDSEWKCLKFQVSREFYLALNNKDGK